MTSPPQPPAPRTPQAVATGEVARHPDLFTPEEAAVYLHLDSVRSLEILRTDFGLVGHKGVGKSYIYHREDLDAVALRMVGKDRAWNLNKSGGLKIASGR